MLSEVLGISGRDYPDGLSESSVAFLLVATEQAVNQETRAALVKFKAGMSEFGQRSPGATVQVSKLFWA
jgi:hypothetical protein